MTKILDWKRAEDPRDIVHLAVQALAEGHLVAFPSESSYFIAASSLRPAAIQNLQVIVDERSAESVKLSNGPRICPAAIVPRSADELLDFIPERSLVTSRLADRLWPGPVKIRLRTEHSNSLISQLKPQVQILVRDSDGYVGFVLPHHESLEEVLRLSIGPLMVVNLATHSVGAEAVGANSVDSRVALVIDDGLARSPSPWTVVRIDGQRACVERQGTWSAEKLVSRSQMKILLICTGNTCRSPMAEQLMKRKLKLRFPEHFANSQLSPIDVISAGVSAYPGGPASDGAIAAMASCGIDLSAHESQLTTQALVEQADLILTMTNSHRHTLLGRWPHLVSKTYGLAPDHGDVSDPYGGSLEIYQKCAENIDQFLEAWIDKLDQDTLPIWSVSGTNGCE